MAEIHKVQMSGFVFRPFPFALLNIDIMFHPTRGGTRGGRDQFSWEDVKTDKDRENYLGNSLMAPVGRWQKGKDLTWYAKEKNSEERRRAQQAELLKLKEAEEDAMAIALGVKKKKTIESNVTKEEIKHALNRDGEDSSEDEGEKGLGFGRNTRITMATGSNSVEIMNKGQDFSSIPSGAANNNNTSSSANDLNDHSDIHTSSKKDKKKKKTKKHKHRHSKKHRHRHDSSDLEDASNSDNSDYDKRSSRHRSHRRSSRHASRSVSPEPHSRRRDRSYSRKDESDRPPRSRSSSPQTRSEQQPSSSSRYDRSSRTGTSPERRSHRSKRTRSRSRSPKRSRTSLSRYSRSPPPRY
ncbi:hypothetical protein [Absidia glauca]|uniref:Multiple myeloma tumor-associated protein 2-like N-terminal domain-containing protein n=1 Tax=Absidia glauca TaxID=4829 RepID=A0A163IYC4_ABSGL|nr:hypothetical protein [Absidia glauca]